MILDEPEILDGMRGYDAAQAAFKGIIDVNSKRYETRVSWYDTQVDPHEGYFCMIQPGSALEDLVGEIVQINYKDKQLLVYCIGGVNLTTPLALQRRAWFKLERPSADVIDVLVQVVASDAP